MLEIRSNGSKWLGQQPDTIAELKETLKNYTLDPVFERYGNFVNRAPQWLSSEYEKQYNGCTRIWGNFLTLSHVFDIITDDEALIREIESLVAENKKMPEYQTARRREFQNEA